MRVALILGCVVLALGACRQPGPEEPPPPPAAAANAEPTPARVTPADFQRLRWLEGQWRGTGGGVNPFYEGYTFVNDTSIRALLYADSTLAQVTDSSEIFVSQGVLTSRGENSESVATEIDGDHVRFRSVGDRGLDYTWTRESDTSWTAVLRATILGEAEERVYMMVRFGASGQGE